MNQPFHLRSRARSRPAGVLHPHRHGGGRRRCRSGRTPRGARQGRDGRDDTDRRSAQIHGRSHTACDRVGREGLGRPVRRRDRQGRRDHRPRPKPRAADRVPGVSRRGHGDHRCFGQAQSEGAPRNRLWRRYDPGDDPARAELARSRADARACSRAATSISMARRARCA